MSTDASMNRDKANEAEQRQKAGQESAMHHREAATDHSKIALEESKEAMKARQMELSGSLEKNTENAKAASKEGGSSLKESLSHLADRAKAFFTPDPPDHAEAAKDHAAAAAHELNEKMKEEASKAHESLSAAAASAKEKKDAAMTKTGEMMEKAKNTVKDTFGGGAGTSDSEAEKMNLPQRSETSGDSAFIGHDDRLKESNKQTPNPTESTKKGD